MSNTLPPSAGRPASVALRSLRLDPENPRIPESMRAEATPELAVLLEMGFDAFAVAQSIAELGYFAAEPLIVLPKPDEEGTYLVAEGNRRLTALLGLADVSVRTNFTDPERWEKLSTRRTISLDMEVPVVIHASRETTHAEIARVHVVGKLAWRPYMQAKYIAARVAEGRTVQEVADLIGVTKSTAANLYRDQAVLAQASSIGLETVQVERAFSLLTVALGNTKIRDHLGAPLGSRMEPDTEPIPADKVEELEEVISWIFGNEDSEAVISDSRQITHLGSVIANDIGLAALRQGDTLEEAKQKVSAAGLDPLTSLLKRLTTAKNALDSASNDIAEHGDLAEVQSIVSDLESLVEGIRSSLTEVSLDSAADSIK